MSEAKINDKFHKELLMLYGIAIEDIDRVKRQQWTHVYAILIAQAGLVAIFFNAAEKALAFCNPVWSFSAALFILTLLGLLLIWSSQQRLDTIRRLIEKVYSPCLTTETRNLLVTDEAKDEFRLLYPAILIVVLVSAFMFFWAMIYV